MRYKLLYVMNTKCRKLLWWFRFFCYAIRGAKIGRSVSFNKLYFTWPHKVVIGSKSILEHDIFFKYDGAYSAGWAIKVGNNVFIGSGTEFNIKHSITIGNDCLIASGCRFVDHDHGIAVNQLMREQDCPGKEIIIEEDVWIGANVVVLKGVVVNKGAIIAAGAVVNRSVPAFEIWGGIPAKKIGERK